VTPQGLSVLIAGGGTGGHVYPGLAVAQELRRRRPDATVTFVGTARGLEATIVPREGFALDVIRSAGLKGKSLVARSRGVGLLPVSARDAWRVISKRRPAIVIGVGGYSAGPVVLLAAWRGVPTMVLEQNAAPGLTNRWLARWVDAAAVNYDETLSYFRGKGFVAGNPVRPEFLDRRGDPEPETPPGGRRRLLVLGGSQGAHAINVAMVAAAPELVRTGVIELVHQTGPRDVGMVREEYERRGVPARVEAFLDPVVDAMRAADLIVCRAGATTLAELAALGRAAILVPLPTAADDHQRRNAQVVAAAGAAVVVDEAEMSAATIGRLVSTLLTDADRLSAMGAAMRRFARPDAAGRIVDRALALAGDGTAGRAR
jgi:UDP-N-acetylglucosamine--N-acetylmuramyl-(pentapeptide) pyrophosphoryl-undecaprenol N-acetylglucosamine transferase